MKYLALSFDDGFSNFLENAYPILKQYCLTATINIVTGFSDQTIYNEWPRLSPEDILFLNREGFEIAMHSNSHLHEETVDDFVLCYKKLSHWIGTQPTGVCMPYNQMPTDVLFSFFRSIGVPYVALGNIGSPLKNSRTNLYRVFRKFAKTNRFDFVIKHFRSAISSNKSAGVTLVGRVPILRDVAPDDYLKLLDLHNNGSALVLMFHSIIKHSDDPCCYREGAWTVKQFDTFVNRICSKKGIKVINTNDLLDLVHRHAKNFS